MSVFFLVFLFKYCIIYLNSIGILDSGPLESLSQTRCESHRNIHDGAFAPFKPYVPYNGRGAVGICNSGGNPSKIQRGRVCAIF